MADDDSTQTTASGVQALIDRIRDDGVKAAKDEAARIVREAKEEAAAIMAKARKEAEESERAASPASRPRTSPPVSLSNWPRATPSRILEPKYAMPSSDT